MDAKQLTQTFLNIQQNLGVPPLDIKTVESFSPPNTIKNGLNIKIEYPLPIRTET